MAFHTFWTFLVRLWTGKRKIRLFFLGFIFLDNILDKCFVRCKYYMPTWQTVCGDGYDDNSFFEIEWWKVDLL